MIELEFPIPREIWPVKMGVFTFVVIAAVTVTCEPKGISLELKDSVVVVG
jgi:hypothetical protein